MLLKAFIASIAARHFRKRWCARARRATEPSSWLSGSWCCVWWHFAPCYCFKFFFFSNAREFFVVLVSAVDDRKLWKFNFLVFSFFFVTKKNLRRIQNGASYENGTFNNIRQTSASPTFNSLPRTSTPQKALYSNGNGSATSGNLSELDSLLQDLSNARYGSAAEKKCEFMSCCVSIPTETFNQQKNVVDVNQSNAGAPVNGASSPGLSQDIIEQIQRPSVDSLLDELSNARSVSPVYAVPHESADGKPKSGRHVTITVRETTTERVSGTPSQCELWKFVFWLLFRCFCDAILNGRKFREILLKIA